MGADEARWQRLIDGLRAGDRDVAREFWDLYGGPLERLAEANLAAGLRRRLGPEDVVQSVCRTFLRRAKVGEFRLADSEDLWRLLCAITLTKIREQTRFHMRKKRGLDQEVHAAPTDDGDAQPEPAAGGPTPAEAAEFADQFEQLLAALDPREREVVELKLQDFTHDEVAARLGCSDRTVLRLLKRVQAHLARVVDPT
jgi:RNA polymerase sigma factor (sigma-70 family)